MSAERDTLAADIAACRRCPMGEKDFDSASGEGAALSTEEAIAYARRSRGERKRPASGWASLTPTERDVVRSLRNAVEPPVDRMSARYHTTLGG
jgi:hypothetical protein